MLPERNTVDFTCNIYGDKLVDFSIDSNMCVLNGRNFIRNVYTSVSIKRFVVVDYCIVAHNDIPF